MIRLLIKNNTRYDFKHKESFVKMIDKLIKAEKISGDVELSLIIVGDTKIRNLSKEYKNKDYITDVLSFPNDWKYLKKITGMNSLGDIYINKNQTIKQAKKYGHSIKREFSYLFLHGTLHLLGYDHKDDKSERTMDEKIENILRKMEVMK